MSLVTNIGIQFFTYDSSPRAICLLQALSEFATDSDKLKAAWQEHDGRRTTRSLASLLQSEGAKIRLNECYIQSFTKNLSPSMIASGIHDATAHLHISPDCEVWAHSSRPTLSDQPSIRRILRSIRNVEHCVGSHKPEIVPSVLQLTFRSRPRTVPQLLEMYQQVVSRAWSRIAAIETLGTVDCGGEWLFFPTSGFNPAITPIEVFLSAAGGKIQRSDWLHWRTSHNVSLEPRPGASGGSPPQWNIHSLEPRVALDASCGNHP